MSPCEIPLDKISRADFMPFLNRSFEVRQEPGEPVVAQFTLTNTYVGGAEYPDRRQPFILIFAGPADPALPQKIYALSEPEFGTMSMFLIPISEDASGRKYQAVFN